MAVRFTAVTDNIVYSDGIIAEGLFTAMIWGWITTDRNSYSNILFIGQSGDSGSTPDAGIDLWYGGEPGDGTTITSEMRNYLATAATAGFGHNAVVGEWYHIAVYGDCRRSSAGGSGTLLTYRHSDRSIVNDPFNNGDLGTWPAGGGGTSQIRVGTLGMSGADPVFNDGRHFGLKIWEGVALTPEQIEWERNFLAPVFYPGNCYLAWPMLFNGDTRDLSGNGRSPTYTSIDTEDGLPMRMAPGSRRSERSAASAPPAGQPTIRRYSTTPHMGGRSAFARAA